jgi:hypothetical protein
VPWKHHVDVGDRERPDESLQELQPRLLLVVRLAHGLGAVLALRLNLSADGLGKASINGCTRILIPTLVLNESDQCMTQPPSRRIRQLLGGREASAARP